MMAMRLTAILLTVTFLHAYGAGYAQSITFSGKDISLREAISAIKKQTDYVVFANESDLKKAKKISLTVFDMPLKDFLGLILKEQPLEYEIRDKTIIFSEKLPSASLSDFLPEPLFVPVLGRVYNGSGQPMAGVNIVVQGTSKGTTTDNRGVFSIDVKEGEILVISSLGFATLPLRLTNGKFRGLPAGPKKAMNGSKLISGEPMTLEVQLEESVSNLDEKIVIGYGATSRRLTTGAISTVSGKQLETQPVMNPLLALRGLVPGLEVIPTGGYASSPVKMLVRGRKNISNIASSEPLIIIDGMPLVIQNLNPSSNLLDDGGGASRIPSMLKYGIANDPAGGESPLFGYNPKDIESITVLKDADATAIYGSRGANGVILINTKKGAVQPMTFNASVSQGITRVTRRYDLMNTQQYVAMRREALKNDGVAINAVSAPDLVLWDTARNVNWQDELWGRTGIVTTVNAGISGGTNNATFRVNGGYSKQQDITTVSGGSKSGSLSLSLDTRTNNQKLTVSLSANYNSTYANPVNQANLVPNLPSNAPAMYKENGELNYEEWNYVRNITGGFLFSPLTQTNVNRGNTLNGAMALNFRPVKGFTFTVSMGYNSSNTNSMNLIPIFGQDPDTNPTGTAAFRNNYSKGWIVDPQLNYSTRVGQGHLSVLVGGTANFSESGYLVTRGSGYTNDDLLQSIVHAPVQETYDARAQMRNAGMFSRISYVFRDKYIINLNGRRDGSSRFGPQNRFGNFGSIGLAWNASDEKWFQSIMPSFISFFKLQGSYGTVGSDNVADNQFLAQWSPGSGLSLVPSYGAVARPLLPQNAVNQRFKWQQNKKMNLGVDMSLLENGIIGIAVQYYRDRCSDQLVQYPTPLFTGFESVYANWPATVQNSGWEFSLNSRIIDRKDMKLSLAGNLSRNRNVLLRYDNINLTPYYTRLLVGKPLGTSYLLHFTGVDPYTGRYTFQDFNHDGTVAGNTSYEPLSSYTDAQVALDLNPRFTGGGALQFTYKSLSFGSYFDFKSAIGRNIYNALGAAGQPLINQPVEFISNHWQKPGDMAKYAAYSTGARIGDTGNAGDFNNSDGLYSDASYFRITNISLSYNLPVVWARKAGLKSANVYMNLQNIYTFTKYKGIDPELQSFTTIPQPKVLTWGISIHL